VTRLPPLHGRIREQLELRLAENGKAGDRINEAEIAESLGISRTPLRKVLKQMEAEGIVEYQQHRGFRLANPERIAAAAGKESNDLLDERVLRDMALGAFPAPVSERALMQRYAVAHGTLMSTLRRLMRDQLVEPSAGRGWVFTDVGPNALESSYRFRQIVEPAVLLADSFHPDRDAFERLDQQHAQAIANIDTLGRRRLFELDASFHRQVALSADSIHLVDAIDRQNNIRRVNEYIGFVRLERIGASMSEHRDIIRSILNSELQLASALMRMHLQISRDETFTHLEEDLELVKSGRLDLLDVGTPDQ
jgi:DNA-binding GntR family transcriptional regulator